MQLSISDEYICLSQTQLAGSLSQSVRFQDQVKEQSLRQGTWEFTDKLQVLDTQFVFPSGSLCLPVGGTRFSTYSIFNFARHL